MEHQSSFCKIVRADLEAHRVRHHGLLWTFLYLITIPGFLAVFLYRLSYACTQKGPLRKAVARLLWRLNVFISTCDIAPETRIGPGLYLPHPMGVVIGAGVVIGKNVHILQNTTLGIRNPDDGFAVANSPTLGNDVYIAAGAVLCGRITVGDRAMVGANAVVLQDIPENSMAVGVPARIVPRGNH